MVSAKITASAPLKKKADHGLSRVEREFVHAMRAMFLHKEQSSGKEKRATSVNPPKGDESKYVRRPRNAKGKPLVAKAVGNSNLHTVEVRIPKEAGKRKAEQVKSSAKRKVERKLAVKRISPSKAKRAEKRKVFYESKRKEELTSRYASITRVTEQAETKKAIPVGKLSAVTPLKEVGELEVVKAFGGAAALDLLAKVGKNDSKDEFKSYWPMLSTETTAFKPKSKIFGGRRGVYWSYSVRNYAKASAKVDAQTTKLRHSWFIPVARKGDLKKDRLPKSVETKTEKGEKKAKLHKAALRKGGKDTLVKIAKTPSQARRLLRRQKARDIAKAEADAEAEKGQKEQDAVLQRTSSLKAVIGSINDINQNMMDGAFDNILRDGRFGEDVRKDVLIEYNVLMKQVGILHRTSGLISSRLGRVLDAIG